MLKLNNIPREAVEFTIVHTVTARASAPIKYYGGFPPPLIHHGRKCVLPASPLHASCPRASPTPALAPHGGRGHLPRRRPPRSPSPPFGCPSPQAASAGAAPVGGLHLAAGGFGGGSCPARPRPDQPHKPSLPPAASNRGQPPAPSNTPHPPHAVFILSALCP